MPALYGPENTARSISLRRSEVRLGGSRSRKGHRYASVVGPFTTGASKTTATLGRRVAICYDDDPMASIHERFMRRAIALTRHCPQLPFGAVIVRGATGEVLAEGWNKSAVNPTWHGEIDAINRLVESGRGEDAVGLVLYSTAEPCPMCVAAILWSGIGTVVFGSSIGYLQQRGWRQIDILADEVVRRSPGWACEVIGGVLERECNALFEVPPR